MIWAAALISRVPRWVWIAFAALVLIAATTALLTYWIRDSNERLVEQSTTVGAQTERAASTEKVIENVEKAKAAVERPADGAVERMRSKYDRSARPDK